MEALQADVEQRSIPAQNSMKQDVLYRLILLVGFVVLVCYRMPHIMHDGRFWAEEGTWFYTNCSRMPWLEALFNSYGGYLNLAANTAGVLAFYFAPFRSAPYVSTIFALIIQTFPAILLCISSQTLFRSRTALLAALLIVLVQPASQEIWLSSIASQCFLNLCVGIILFLQPETLLAKRLFQYFVLFFAPLCGPASIFLLPIFIARAFFDKSKNRAYQAAILGTGAFLQLAFFFKKADRSMYMDWLLYLKIAFVKHIVLPFLGRVEAKDIADQIYLLQITKSENWPPVILTVAFFAIYLFIVLKCRSRDAFWLLGSGLALSTLSFLAALLDRSPMLMVDAGNRYTYAPQVLFELSLLVLAFSATLHSVRKAASWVMLWLIFVGCHEYFYSPASFANGPNWRAEVKKWKKNPDYVIKLWPKNWTIQIRPENMKQP